MVLERQFFPCLSFLELLPCLWDAQRLERQGFEGCYCVKSRVKCVKSRVKCVKSRSLFTGFCQSKPKLSAAFFVNCVYFRVIAPPLYVDAF